MGSWFNRVGVDAAKTRTEHPQVYVQCRVDSRLTVQRHRVRGRLHPLLSVKSAQKWQLKWGKHWQQPTKAKVLSFLRRLNETEKPSSGTRYSFDG